MWWLAVRIATSVANHSVSKWSVKRADSVANALAAVWLTTPLPSSRRRSIRLTSGPGVASNPPAAPSAVPPSSGSASCRIPWSTIQASSSACRLGSRCWHRLPAVSASCYYFQLLADMMADPRIEPYTQLHSLHFSLCLQC